MGAQWYKVSSPDGNVDDIGLQIKLSIEVVSGSQAAGHVHEAAAPPSPSSLLDSGLVVDPKALMRKLSPRRLHQELNLLERQNPRSDPLNPRKLPVRTQALFEKEFPGLCKDDTLIDAFGSALKGKRGLMIGGTLFLTDRHVCFFASQLGAKKQHVCIALNEIDDVHLSTFARVVPNAVSIVTKKKKYFFGSLSNRSAVMTAILDLRDIARARVASPRRVSRSPSPSPSSSRSGSRIGDRPGSPASPTSKSPFLSPRTQTFESGDMLAAASSGDDDDRSRSLSRGPSPAPQVPPPETPLPPLLPEAGANRRTSQGVVLPPNITVDFALSLRSSLVEDSSSLRASTETQHQHRATTKTKKKKNGGSSSSAAAAASGPLSFSTTATTTTGSAAARLDDVASASASASCSSRSDATDMAAEFRAVRAPPAVVDAASSTSAPVSPRFGSLSLHSPAGDQTTGSSGSAARRSGGIGGGISGGSGVVVNKLSKANLLRRANNNNNNNNQFSLMSDYDDSDKDEVRSTAATRGSQLFRSQRDFIDLDQDQEIINYNDDENNNDDGNDSNLNDDKNNNDINDDDDDRDDDDDDVNQVINALSVAEEKATTTRATGAGDDGDDDDGLLNIFGDGTDEILFKNLDTGEVISEKKVKKRLNPKTGIIEECNVPLWKRFFVAPLKK